MSHSLPVFTPGAGVLDLYPVAFAHPCGMPCIFKQVLHFEISSWRDISRWLNISGSRIPQPSERKYRLRCIRLHSESQVCPRNCPLVSTHLLLPTPPPPIYPVHRSSWRSAEALHASHISSGLKPDRCHDGVINKGAPPYEHDLQHTVGQRFFNLFYPRNQTREAYFQNCPSFNIPFKESPAHYVNVSTLKHVYSIPNK